MGGPGNRIGQPLLGTSDAPPPAGSGSMGTTPPRVSFSPDTAVRVHPRRTSLNTDSTEAATDKQYGFAVTPRVPARSTRLIFWLLGALQCCCRLPRMLQPPRHGVACRNECGKDPSAPVPRAFPAPPPNAPN